MLKFDVVPGVHMIQHAHVNCYLLQDDDGLTLVDAGLPGVWRKLEQAVGKLGKRLEDIKALVLTHAHFDHVGTARRLRERLGLPIHAHEAERELVAHPYRYAHENPRAAYPIKHPKAIPILAAMTAAGALWVRGVKGVTTMSPGEIVDVPVRPHREDHGGYYIVFSAFEQDLVINGWGWGLAAAICAIPGVGWALCSLVALSLTVLTTYAGTQKSCKGRPAKVYPNLRGPSRLVCL